MSEVVPQAVRSVFGHNLRLLLEERGSISAVAAQLGIHRTQLNRYMNSESFPRPDVLDNICKHFDVDARIYVEPLAELRNAKMAACPRLLQNFLSVNPNLVHEEDFPSGFYKFSRRSFVDATKFLTGLTFVKRVQGLTYVRGYEPNVFMNAMGHRTDAEVREWLALVQKTEFGLIFIGASPTFATSMNYLTFEHSRNGKFWIGYAATQARENVVRARATRMVYEHIGTDFRTAMEARRSTGLIELDRLDKEHKRFLKTDQEFK